VNKEFHYWTDIIEHLSPARYKSQEEALKTEAPFVLTNRWVTPEEKMDEQFLKYIIKEKDFGVRTAEKALKLVKKAKPVLAEKDYNQIYNLFYRTLLTTWVYKAIATSYFGYRVYARGEEFRSMWLIETMQEALDSMLIIADEIDSYQEKVPRGQWNWRGDAATVREYHKKIAETGWKEYGNVVFDPSPVSRDLP